MALTVPAVPTGMNAGVRMTPRGMRISPVRAAPSVLVTVKVNWSVLMGISQRRAGLRTLFPKQQARVAVRIEAIAGFDRPRIGGAHGIETREGGHQHVQGRARQ